MNNNEKVSNVIAVIFKCKHINPLSGGANIQQGKDHLGPSLYIDEGCVLSYKVSSECMDEALGLFGNTYRVFFFFPHFMTLYWFLKYDLLCYYI